MEKCTSVLTYLKDLELENNLGPMFGAAYSVGVKAAFAVIMDIIANEGDPVLQRTRLLQVALDAEVITTLCVKAREQAEEESLADALENWVPRSDAVN